MMRSEREKMLAGELYDPMDPELVRARARARDLCWDLNATRDAQHEERRRILEELFGSGGETAWMQPPFFCDYGTNIHLGERVFFNFNCVVLDVCRVTIGDYAQFGPSVQIYTATHPMDAALRRSQEFARPIEIGSDVWVGGGATLCPGVRIGCRSVIGAGSVVTRDIPEGVFAAGNPCRVIRQIAGEAAISARLGDGADVLRTNPNPKRKTTMSHVPSRETFESMYAGKAPWDIDKPQPAFVAVADRVTGAVLDAGCGTGENALFFASKGRPVVGIDFLEGPLQEARRKAQERGQNVEFLGMDALTLSTFDRQFDSVIDSGLFHVFADKDRVRYVAGLAHVTKAGGRVFVLCFSDEEPGEQGPRRVSERELRESFGDGWVIEEIRPVHLEVRSDLEGFSFSEGGPKGWFSVIRREG
jgi:maltose O-acetyltransferase